MADSEFAQLVRALQVVDPVQSLAAFSPGSIGMIPPRRYSDTTLARVAVSPNTVVCECPRHIAELIGQLSSFEEYSERCLNDTAEDAQVHALLRSISGSARALFEHALQVVAQHGGLELEEAPVPDAAVPAT